MTFEDAIAQVILAQELPDVLDRFNSGVRAAGEVGWCFFLDPQLSTCLMPSGSIEEEDGVTALRNLAVPTIGERWVWFKAGWAAYPPGVYSLSHVALPFPISDSLYGMQPDPAENFGVNLGAIAPRGERGTLIISMDALLRMSSNPFFPYMIERIEEAIPAAAAEPQIKAAPPP